MPQEDIIRTENLYTDNWNSMFYVATSFNQDLSGWCVTIIESKPIGFDRDTLAWDPKEGRQPIWGECPTP